MKVHIGPFRKNRKIDIRIDSYDTWNMDSTLAHIIVPMLKQLKETKHGSPYMPAHEQISTNSVQYCFDFYQEEDNYAWEMAHKQWEEIMDKMIWAFEQVNIDWETQYESGQIDHVYKNIPGTDLVESTRGPNHTYVIDSEGVENHCKRMQEGFELFGKYYKNLWD